MGATLLLERTVRVAAAPAGIKNVVLVHGAFADGSGWEAVARSSRRMATRCQWRSPPRPPTPRTSSPRRRRRRHERPVVIVGHSYGGSIITEAVTIRRFRHWSTSPHLHSMKVTAVRRSTGPAASVQSIQAGQQRELVIDETHFAADFAADIPRRVHYMAISQVPISTDSFTHKVTNPPGRPSPPGTWWPPQTDRSIRTRSA